MQIWKFLFFLYWNFCMSSHYLFKTFDVLAFNGTFLMTFNTSQQYFMTFLNIDIGMQVLNRQQRFFFSFCKMDDLSEMLA